MTEIEKLNIIDNTNISMEVLKKENEFRKINPFDAEYFAYLWLLFSQYLVNDSPCWREISPFTGVQPLGRASRQALVVITAYDA